MAIAGAAGGAAAIGATGTLVAPLKPLAVMILVNSPGPVSVVGIGISAAVLGSAGGTGRTPSDNLWINLVTLADSTADGASGGLGVNDGSESTDPGLTSCLTCSLRCPPIPMEAISPVALVALAPGSTGASTGLISDCRCHLISAGAGAGVGGGCGGG